MAKLSQQRSIVGALTSQRTNKNYKFQLQMAWRKQEVRNRKQTQNRTCRPVPTLPVAANIERFKFMSHAMRLVD